LLGHSNISTTQRYLRLDHRELAEAQDLIEYARGGRWPRDGMIWGVELGGLVSVVLGLVIVRSSWRRFRT